MFPQFDIDIGDLLSCVSISNPSLNLFVLQKLAPLTSASEEPYVNEFHCPLLKLTNDLYVIPVLSVIKPVSIVHSCTNSCKLVDNVTPVHIEREPVACSKLVFLHDVCNSTFCYNIFCTSNSF